MRVGGLQNGFQLRHKLLMLGVGGVVVTASILVGVGAYESNSFQETTEESVNTLTQDDLNHVSAGITRLVKASGDTVQNQVNANMTTANTVLANSGGMSLDGGQTVSWNAINQVDQKTTAVSLPRVEVGGEWLGQNRDLRSATPLVDDITGLIGGYVTVFQRMNEAGDLLRVATNVKAANGNRAIGTYIPAKNADGSDNAVASAIKAGNSYRGVAQVVGTWFITAYDPVKDANGRVIGSLFYGVPQAEAIQELTDTIAATTVGRNGWVSVLSAGATDRGRVIASNIEEAVGETLLDATDADGTAYVDEIISTAESLEADAGATATYQLAGTTDSAVADTRTVISYYEPYKWAIAVGGYLPDYSAALDKVEAGRSEMLTAFIAVGLILALGGGVIAYGQARRISRRVGDLTGALAGLAERDLTVRVAPSGGDEIARMGHALNTAVTGLRELMSEVTDASRQVSQAAGRVADVGGELATASSTASSEAGVAGRTAADVSRAVSTVAAGAEEMGASISEISSNAQEAAAAGRDGVGLTKKAADVIDELRVSSEKIADVVKLIASIAEQTNLLALNATIEAARAGAAGKGFAVVAGEVKELAQETARATEDVTARVSAIDADTAKAVQAIEAITATITRVNDFQNAIAAAVEEQAATTNEMARNIGEVAQGSEQIAATMNRVNDTVDTTRGAVDTSQAAASTLSGTASHLQTLVGRFRL
ncbi:methyl-accepting chemotaxis protein [Catenuloplanes atrovinosus]|uniref:Methyl-accepting chemotaxis protein n=1 Tax=Catenuloplanes atrovinosus TaxID=137266 RepID=A0AAE3YR16_9ACTN|nr:methyl-accepting chemotaxis protein [Catenuloplanes atrovinosus]MDR7278408.1 methyl-accepting chemotaxis protein [Catenuloplanes atrovinosus]